MGFSRAFECIAGLALPFCTAALVAGCPEPAASATPPAEAVAPLEFDAARAWRHTVAQVELGPRPAGSEAAESTRKYLEAELTSYGLTPVREAFRAPTPVGEIDFCNLYADLGALGDTTRTSPLVIWISHYDTKRMEGFVGANDGASSTGVLLEFARVLAQRGPGKVTHRFLFVDGEEALRKDWADPDNRYGSRHHAEQLPKSGDKNRVRAAVVIDMVGDKELKILRDDYSTPWLYEVFAAAARQNGLGKHVDGTREPIADDHLSFRALGLPALTLIDLDFGPSNSWWHNPAKDVLENCSQESLAAIGRILCLGLPGLEERALR